MKEVKGTMLTEDRTQIKSVCFRFPELMKENAEEKIKRDYYDLLGLQDRLYEAREAVRKLEDELTIKQKEFKEKTSLCTIEFETHESEYVNYESNALLKNMGNDTLGHYNT